MTYIGLINIQSDISNIKLDLFFLRKNGCLPITHIVDIYELW